MYSAQNGHVLTFPSCFSIHVGPLLLVRAGIATSRMKANKGEMITASANQPAPFRPRELAATATMIAKIIHMKINSIFLTPQEERRMFRNQWWRASRGFYGVWPAKFDSRTSPKG
ncbi:hypothetical protein XH93_21600 [Bradyrhizobium sp. CCBAU 51753]|nr:hypothetical protein XH93_21600 [Bradyrhizobium sp. CCBAU 51753]